MTKKREMTREEFEEFKARWTPKTHDRLVKRLCREVFGDESNPAVWDEGAPPKIKKAASKEP